MQTAAKVEESKVDSMNFWSDKKEGFVKIKEWEDKRRATMFKNKMILVSML